MLVCVRDGARLNVVPRGRKVLENRNVNDEERIVQLEKELEETIMHGEESDRKFEEVTRARC